MAVKVDEIKNAMIFRSMTDDEVKTSLSSLSAHVKEYKKGSFVLHAGQATDSMGLVLKGSVTIENNDVWGNKTILSRVGSGEFFAETYALLGNEPLLVDVVAVENSRILFLRISELQNPSSVTESWKARLTSNLLSISAQKNLTLSGRSFHTSPKTIRGRVMSYLDSVSLKKGAGEFDIPFDRQQMADYLNLDRSALSKELGKMQEDGLISFRKNHFILHETGTC